jgi:hypothetical protein
MEHLGSHWTDFHEIWHLSIFRKFVLKSDKNNGHFTWRPEYIFCQISLRWSITFFPRKSCRVWYKVEKYCRAGLATDDNMAREHCMLDNWGYRHTIRVCNTCCFSTATVVVRTRLNVTLYVRCLPCLLLSKQYFLLVSSRCVFSRYEQSQR